MTKRDSYDSTARDSCRVTCDSKALMLFSMQWPKDTAMTVWPKTNSCRVTCDCKALMLFVMQWPKETAMTVWPKTNSCRVTCDCKALLFRTHSDQLWQYGPRQRVVELPVTVRPCCSERTVTSYDSMAQDKELPVTARPWCCSECTVTKRDSYDSMAQDKEL